MLSGMSSRSSQEAGVVALEMDAAGASTALSAALKPFKISTRQLTIRECCGGAKGLRLADLPATEDGE
jgi:S-DNA-T family DNA segregation ATPase FtsK/SpoIIIE